MPGGRWHYNITLTDGRTFRLDNYDRVQRSLAESGVVVSPSVWRQPSIDADHSRALDEISSTRRRLILRSLFGWLAPILTPPFLVAIVRYVRWGRILGR